MTLDGGSSTGLERLGMRLLVPLALALVALVGLALVADARELAASLAAFDPALLLPVLGLSLVNYGLRFARWQVYLRRVEVDLAPRDSLATFLVGFVLSVTPGKAGELGKAWIVRRLGGGAARRAIAVVLAERVSDLAAIFLLSAVGALALPGGRWIALVCVLAAAAMVAVLAWRRAAAVLLGVAGRVPVLREASEVLSEVYDRLRELLRPATLAAGLALALPAWAAEGIGFALVARGYEASAGWLVGLFNYSASTLVGALSLLPGGLLASEGTLTALLGAQGMTTAAAASATLLIRGATLWFAVGLGLVALPYVVRRLRGS